MSNIDLKGDIIQDLGEYLPNVYIESIEVTEETRNGFPYIDLNVFYSLIFLIDDDYNIEDIKDNLLNINFFYSFGSSQSAEKKKTIIEKYLNLTTRQVYETARDFVNGSEVASLLNNNQNYQDDLYDQEGRRILKISGQAEISQVKLGSIGDNNFYFYVFSSLLNEQTDFQSNSGNSADILYLNTSNFAYEKIFSPNLNILRDEEVIYVGTQGEKYGQVPILGLNRNFYKTENVTREDIISKVNALVKRFEGRTIGPLSDSVNSIKTVLSKEADTENLLVQLDKVRRSFPNKTNNNRVGNLYAAFAVLLRNINSAFRPVDIVKKEKYLTGKVLDLRENAVRAYEAPTRFSLDQYIPEEMFFLHRERISEDETSDLSINRGIFFVRYEELFKRESNIAGLINIDKFYEIVTGPELQTLKRILFSYFRVQDIFIQKSYENNPLSSYLASYGTLRRNRYGSRNGYPDSPTSGLLVGTNTHLKAVEILESSELYPERFKEYNFEFDNPPERMLCYSFVDADGFTATYEESQIGGMVFDYYLEAVIYDDTELFLSYLINEFTSINTLLQDYKDLANEICSYNNIDNRFNDFFVKSIRDQYADGVYPWEVAPSIYSVMVYLLTEQFPTFEDVIRYSKNVSATINPENGNLDSLTNFANAMDSLKSAQIEQLSGPLQDIINGPVTKHRKGLDKTFQVLAFNYRKLLSEADAEFESLFRNTMNFYDGADIVVDSAGTPRNSAGGAVDLTRLSQTQFMERLIREIEFFFFAFTAFYGMTESYVFTARQQTDLGNYIQVFINDLQTQFRNKRNNQLKTVGFYKFFSFGSIGNRTIDDVFINNICRVFFNNVVNVYNQSDVESFDVSFSQIDSELNNIANLIYNYYLSHIQDGKPSLQYDISVVDFAITGVESQIKNWIVVPSILGENELPGVLGNYTGPDLDEIVGYENLQFD